MIIIDADNRPIKIDSLEIQLSSEELKEFVDDFDDLKNNPHYERFIIDGDDQNDETKIYNSLYIFFLTKNIYKGLTPTLKSLISKNEIN